jgi:SAM-dependent methyltransferase
MTPITLDGAAARTFAGCAPFYDSLTAHHDYEEVARILERLLARSGHPGRRMLDVACGTGKSFMPFVRRGYEVTACDISPEMLDQARRKVDGAAELVVADMRDLPRLGGFDFATCIDEPLNYLLEPEEVERAFASVARNLRPGGLFLFDLNTLHAFRSIFARDECYEQEGWLFVWRGHGDGETESGGRSAFTIEAFVEESAGAWTRLTNQHLQRHYPPAQVTDLLARAGLECLDVFGLTPDGVLHAEPDEHRHTKHFYVARNSPRSRRR